jgi:hypothetical protein
MSAEDRAWLVRLLESLGRSNRKRLRTKLPEHERAWASAHAQREERIVAELQKG